MMSETRVVFLFAVWVLAVVSAAADDGLTRRDGQYVRLTTDLASEEEVQRLVESFDAAVPQWIQFWNLSNSDFASFQVDACVMRDPERFKRQGLIPENVPDFPFGYAQGQQIWVHAQPSEYYTRHLMLHEGVHCLAFAAFGGAGPTWYQEGTAELLATHAGTGTELTVNRIPANRQEVPYWGRFKRMAQQRRDGMIPSLSTVMGYQPDLKGNVGTYGWSWAAAMLLHAYPEYREAFFAAAKNGRTVGPGFNRRLERTLGQQLPILAARWQVMSQDLDYGFDWSRERVNLSIDDPIWDGRSLTATVAADRGWQSAGVRVPRGARLRLKASGEVTLARTTRPWISQPRGITFQYHRGRPLGQLLLCVLPNATDFDAATVGPLPMVELSDEASIDIPQFSWLLFRVNDDVGKLEDNRGHYEVTVSR